LTWPHCGQMTVAPLGAGPAEWAGAAEGAGAGAGAGAGSGAAGRGGAEGAYAGAGWEAMGAAAGSGPRVAAGAGMDTVPPASADAPTGLTPWGGVWGENGFGATSRGSSAPQPKQNF
jgi:hypothetical protein